MAVASPAPTVPVMALHRSQSTRSLEKRARRPKIKEAGGAAAYHYRFRRGTRAGSAGTPRWRGRSCPRRACRWYCFRTRPCRAARQRRRRESVPHSLATPSLFTDKRAVFLFCGAFRGRVSGVGTLMGRGACGGGGAPRRGGGTQYELRNRLDGGGRREAIGRKPATLAKMIFRHSGSKKVLSQSRSHCFSRLPRLAWASLHTRWNVLQYQR